MGVVIFFACDLEFSFPAIVIVVAQGGAVGGALLLLLLLVGTQGGVLAKTPANAAIPFDVVAGIAIPFCSACAPFTLGSAVFRPCATPPLLLLLVTATC